MYTNDAMINEIKTFREDSFARELVYLNFPITTFVNFLSLFLKKNCKNIAM
jgi:hypothetical protein